MSAACPQRWSAPEPSPRLSEPLGPCRGADAAADTPTCSPSGSPGLLGFLPAALLSRPCHEHLGTVGRACGTAGKGSFGRHELPFSCGKGPSQSEEAESESRWGWRISVHTLLSWLFPSEDAIGASETSEEGGQSQAFPEPLTTDLKRWALC